MRVRLEPIPDGMAPAPSGDRRKTAFAIFGRSEMETLAQSMPDARSAILFCIAWHVALQVRMERGPLAGQRLARVSANRLAAITKRPLRTVRYAISKLRAHGLLEVAVSSPGRTSVYRLPPPNEDRIASGANGAHYAPAGPTGDEEV